MKKTKYALLSSVLALVLCVSMLIGSTFAWFTDRVSTGSNVIKAGNLDVEVEYSTDLTNWKTVTESTTLFSENTLWEPGHTEVAYLRVSNKGDLALKYQFGINVLAETGSTNTLGERFLLSDYIEFGVINDVSAAFADREAARKAVTTSTKVKEGYSQDGSLEAGEEKDVVALVVFMPESVGNEANTAAKEVAPKIQLGVDVVATQAMNEPDSFDNTYDANATFPGEPIHYSIGESVKSKISENNTLTEEVTIGDTQGDIYAVAPRDLKLAKDAEVLQLSVNTMEESKANVTLADGETSTSLDIHVEGVAEDNTVPMLITLEKFFPKYMNTTSVAMYHVEDGNTVAMTLTSNPTAHNQFSYDPATGTVVLCVASFSEYVAVVDNLNPWEGTANKDWYNSTATEFTLTTAEQLAGFGVLVDGGNTFAGKTIKLGADINLSGTKSFNPIGCGYVNGVQNSKDEDGNVVPGTAFMGTFDGQGHTISNLYQNGWDLGLSYCTLGGGLFASVANGTIKNLTMTGARITMECVEMGVVAGLSQGTCTYENIKIYDSKVANYQRATGGLIGEVSAFNDGGTTTIKDVTIGSDVVVGTLWGDFDAPVGGVIGARWDDADVTKVNMTNVKVAARLDVYNDITSTYQWHAYRRAGMLIGNTDTPPANGKDAQTATAPFLTCSNVVVCYGSWVNYHYCEFNNHNSSWPFVRVEAGENCEAYSNPRWGVPNDINGNKVVDDKHVHATGDTCMELIKFNQLYGGGQGVYGQPAHTGVDVQNYYYKVEYINNGVTHVTVEVTDANLNGDGTFTVANSKADSAVENQMGEDYDVIYWMNAGSTKIETIPAGNLEDVKLYPSFKDRYTVTYVDNNGEILHWETITAGTEKTETTPAVPAIDGGYTGVWSMTDFSEITSDVTVYPVYNADDGIVKLEPVDLEPKDGIIDHYNVASVVENDANINIIIPSTFNGKPVLGINGSAFAEFDNITTVRIPVSITTIGADAFANKENSGFLGALKYEQITFLYEGTYEQWQAINKDPNWDQYVGQGSRIYFLADGTYSEETARNGTWSAPDRVWSAPKEGTYSP